MEENRTTTVETLTVEEYARLPEDDESRVELVRGRLVREPRPGARHSSIAGRLYYALETFARETGVGIVAFEAGFVLEDEPPTVRGPDVAVVASERLPENGTPVGFWELAPDLAVEIVSPSNRVSEIQQKVLEYLAAGTRMVWVVDPETESLTAYRSRDEARVLTVADTLEGADVLPGFRLDVADLFAS